MIQRLFAAALALAVLGSAGAAPIPALAQPHDDRWQGDRNSGWDPSSHYRPARHASRPMSRDERVYRGGDGRYYCRRSDGTTGLVAGAIGGAILGGAIGGDTLSALLGGAGGAALGSSIDRGHVRCS